MRHNSKKKSDFLPDKLLGPTLRAPTMGKLLCLRPLVVALIISVPGHTFTIEISMCIQIIGYIYRHDTISVGIPVGVLEDNPLALSCLWKADLLCLN